MTINWILVESSRMRYAAGSAMYFAQGIPYGLMNIAVPAWLASQGVGAGQIASFLAVIILPWAFKLLSGPLMDRYQFLAMGRRRPWVIGAQLGMTLSFFSLILVDNPPEQVGLLMMLGLFINIFAATQDVAVDGLAVDILEEDERARGSGMMFGGQAIGISAGTALNGWAIAKFGPATAYLSTAMLIGLATLFVVSLRERPGERLFPWSTGETHPRNLTMHVGAWRPILSSTFWSMQIQASGPRRARASAVHSGVTLQG